jgi:predicted ATPase with chaperone activity
MYGPPGCGKTFIARAVAGDMGARFMPVSFADVIDMFVGQRERNRPARLSCRPPIGRPDGSRSCRARQATGVPTPRRGC